MKLDLRHLKKMRYEIETELDLAHLKETPFRYMRASFSLTKFIS